MRAPPKSRPARKSKLGVPPKETFDPEAPIKSKESPPPRGHTTERSYAELSQANSDLTNLFSSLEIPILILGRDLRLMRFSPAAESLFSLSPADVGRSVNDLDFDGAISHLGQLCMAVMETERPSDHALQSSDGRRYSLRIHPYRLAGNKIEGAVVAFVDITAQSRERRRLEDARQYAQTIIEAVQESLLVLDSDLRVVTANRSFHKTFRVDPESTVGKLVYDLGNGQWNIPELRAMLAEILSRETHLSNFEVEHDFPAIGRKTMLLNGRPFRSPKTGGPLILLAIQDETERRKAELAAMRYNVMSASLMRVQDEERRRVARELHDRTAQHLAGLMMNMNYLSRMLRKAKPKILAKLAESRSLADDAIREIRTISYLLHPPLLEEAGLAPAMRWFIEGFGNRSGLTIRASIPARLPRLSQKVELALFRIAQEALANVHRHSGSKSARIRIVATPAKIILEVIDKGRGLPTEAQKSEGGISKVEGVGLASMRERIRQVGGSLEIVSGRRGTTVRAIAPLVKR